MIATATITGLALVICIYSIFVGPRTVSKSKLITVEKVRLNNSRPVKGKQNFGIMKSKDRNKSESADDLIQVTHDEFQFCHTQQIS